MYSDRIGEVCIEIVCTRIRIRARTHARTYNAHKVGRTVWVPGPIDIATIVSPPID